MTIVLDGIEFPNRFPNQGALEAFAATLDDDGFVTLTKLLMGRRWTISEFVDRIVNLRPDHPVWETPAMEDVMKAYVAQKDATEPQVAQTA